MPLSPLHLLLDYDGTLTMRDTINVLAEIGYTTSAGEATGSTPPRPTPSRPWDAIVQAYGEDYAAYVAAYKPGKEARRTVQDEVAFLESLTPVERRSIERVEEAGVFTGLTQRGIEEGATNAIMDGTVQLRRGWSELIQHVVQAGKVGIVSVNWSRTFIRQTLVSSASRSSAKEPVLDALRLVPIGANDIAGLEVGRPVSGQMERHFADRGEGIWTAGHKKRLMRQMLEGRGSERTIYVGDSMTDLACLIEAEVGIVIRDDPMRSGQKDLADCLHRLGIEIRWIGAYDGQGNPRSGIDPILWWAADFTQILDSPLMAHS